MGAQRWLRSGRDRLSAWLPAFLMLLFALGTWWLVRNAPQLSDPGDERPALREPDYVMERFSVRSFAADGSLRTEIKGPRGHHRPDQDTLEISDPRLRSYDARGTLTTARARLGISRQGGDDITLRGDAHVIRQAAGGSPGAPATQTRFDGEHLRLFPETGLLHSDEPVTLVRGADQFVGDRLDYDDRTGVAHLSGNVRGTLAARSAPAQPERAEQRDRGDAGAPLGDQ